MSDPIQHSLIEDAQGMAFGVAIAAVGMHILTFMGFVAGQTTGVAALISYATGWPFPWVYLGVSVPFLWFGWRRIGPRFAIKTLIAVASLSILTSYLPQWMTFSTIEPAFAAPLFGAMFGIAALAVVRHGGSFGGISILWILLQDRTGFRAGYAQLFSDAVIFAAALLILPAQTVAWSFLGAVVFNLFLAVNHRKDRYIAT
jgi:uncharacterized membrane-anchored protein YitT (DUF2179 family)